MAKQIINIGSTADDGTGSTIRAGGSIINDNFNEVYTLLGNGTTLHSLTFPNVTDTIVTKTQLIYLPTKLLMLQIIHFQIFQIQHLQITLLQ
jgi:Bacteriophage T4 gp9/10-like protein.